MIRPATLSDAARLAALHNASFGPRGERVWDQKEWQDLLNGKSVQCLVSLQNQGIVAALLVQIAGDQADIVTIMTAPDAQGSGIGSLLLAHFIKTASDFGVSTINLEVAADNAAAKALYRKHGFAEVGCRPNYYKRHDGTSIDALVLQAEI